jgi:hypothetical protein
MADEEQRLIDEARRSREKTEELREEAEEETEDEPGHPGAKTSSGGADSVTEDD